MLSVTSCFTQFNTVVERVRVVVTTEEKARWEVTSSDPSGGVRTETFDAVFVCSG